VDGGRLVLAESGRMEGMTRSQGFGRVLDCAVGVVGKANSGL
jgi:hypothetical protein